MAPPPAARQGLGLAAALATVSIWASFMLVTRNAVDGAFTVAELIFLRMVPADILLALAMLSKGVVPHGLPPAGPALDDDRRAHRLPGTADAWPSVGLGCRGAGARDHAVLGGPRGLGACGRAAGPPSAGWS